MPVLRPAAFLLLLGTAASQLTFHADEGLVLLKEFDASLILELDELTLSVDGNDMSDAIPLDGFELEASVSAVTSDEYQEVAGGRPVELVRDFEELVLAYEARDQQDSQNLDKFEGVQVLFSWNEDDEQYDISLTDDSEDVEPDFVKVLLEDMDFRALLPEEDASEGDSWEVASDAIGGVLLPGLSLSTVADLAERDGQLPTQFMEQLEGLPEDLEMHCEYRGQREEAGVTVGVIGLSIEGSGSLELASVLADEISLGDEVTPEIDQATLELGLEGDGELLWDLEGGHMHSISLEAELDIELIVSATIEAQGDTHQIDGSVLVVGDVEWSATCSSD